LRITFGRSLHCQKIMGSRQVLATSEMAENGTNLIVGLRFRGLRGPVDQPGTQHVQGLAEDRPLGRSSSTLNAGKQKHCSVGPRVQIPPGPPRTSLGARGSSRPPGGRKNSLLRGFGKWFPKKKRFLEVVFQMYCFRNLFSRDRIFRKRFQEGDFENAIPRIGFR